MIARVRNCLPVFGDSGYVARMIIAVANSKGGVGKSTLSVHLAVWFHEQLGAKTVLVDCDTQHSSAEWLLTARPEIEAVCLENPNDILNELPELTEQYDVVVCDGPGSQTEVSRALLLVADLAILPCKASMLEVRALAKVTEVLRQAQQIRSGPPNGLAVLSMVGQRYRLTHDMRDATEALNLRLAKTPIILRQIYADAPGQGMVVFEMGPRSRSAAKELESLFCEIAEVCGLRDRQPLITANI